MRPIYEALPLSGRAVSPGYLWARWLFLRALGLIFLSAFYSLLSQIHGLIGERGILPARTYFESIRSAGVGVRRFWYAPSLFWVSTSDTILIAVVVAGMVSSVLLTMNLWPKASVALSTLFFLSCIAALQEFSSYQSDGMLLEAGFISMFFAPHGVRPGLGASDPPSKASLFMLRWEWFRIYFESGVAKLASGDIHWRNLTAMDDYYQNGPLPAWPGWYVQQLPHGFHATTVVVTLFVELILVWAVFLPRRFRVACFVAVTGLQLGIIATANYAFLNYLVLVLGVLLLDDDVMRRVRLTTPSSLAVPARWPNYVQYGALATVLYATVAAVSPSGWSTPLGMPARLLAPFRIANQYGLFASMTEARYEIEFQGSLDGGNTWLPYEFRYKPQDVAARPGIYAPYQPRFEWNLWFASLGPWRASPWVALAQERLVERSPSVLALFRNDPFHGVPPTHVRTVLWQYWFTDRATKRATGAWWRRRELGLFAGVVTRGPDGRIVFSQQP